MPSTDRLIEIFNEANALPAGAERERFLAQLGEIELREQVISLLQSHTDAGDFLKNSMFSPAPLLTEKTGDVIGRYKLMEKIGEGGCGVVYVAEQTVPVRRRVALKVIKLGMDTRQVIARFEAERQALAMMDHPNIAKVLDASSTEMGRPYFVMELVRGIRITDYCDENNLSTGERLDLFIKVCQAIQHAHQKGVIHRDIKPSNILVTLHDGMPVPKVIDFGIAKAIEGRLTDATVYTQLLQFVGTPAYMSPEQAEMSGLDIDTRSDIYSLGVLLYELLTGQPPFDGQKLVASGLDAMRKTIRETEPARPSTKLNQTPAANEARRLASKIALRHRPAIDNDLDWIVMKCLEKDRSRRYDTANGLAADLTRHLNDEPIVARPPNAAYKFQKAWRRNKLVFASSAAVAFALLAGIGLSTWQAFEASRARDVAQAARLQADAQKVHAEYNLYVANINRAGQAWEQNNVDLVRQLLVETRTFPDRGFEWYYWQRQAHLSLSTFRGHLQRVNSAAFSPNGQRVITGSDDQTARVWDAANGRELFKLIGHRSGITSAVFSPDGQFIVTGSHDQTARIWNAANHHEVFQHFGHKAGISSVAFSPDGLRIATASYDGTAKVWEAMSDRDALTTLQGHRSKVHSVAFSPSGKSILTGGEDRTARVWDAATGRELVKIEGHSRPILAVAFSRDGLRVLTGSNDQTARVWDAATGKQLLEFPARGPVGCVGFSPDGQRVVTGSWNSTATVWDAVTGDKLFIIRADARSVLSVAFSPDGEQIITGGGDGTPNVWAASGQRESIVLRGNASPILAVAISPDGQRIVTGGGPVSDIAAIDIAAIGNEAAQVWENASGKKLFTLDGHSSGISSAAFSPDGRWIVTGSGDQTARLWTAATGQQARKFEGHEGAVNSVAFSPDSHRVVTGGEDGIARVWEVATGQELFKMEGHRTPIRAVAFSPKGPRIATGSFDQTVTIWDADSGEKRRTLDSPHLIKVLGVAFSPDGRHVVACGWPRLAIVWEEDTGRELFKLRGHLSPVSAVAFSRDGRRIVTSAYDRCAKLWDAGTGRELLSLNSNGNELSSVAFSQDGQQIVTGDWNRTARVWEVARLDQVVAWEAEERAAEDSQDRWRKELDALLLSKQANNFGQ